LRSSESRVWTIAAPTTTRVNHLLSAIIKLVEFFPADHTLRPIK
jgi:hypothetical protein